MSISKAEHDELCCVYAGLLLFDDGVEITADKMNKVISASGNSVESYYPDFFAKYLKSVDLNQILQNVGSAPATSGPVAAAVEEKSADKGADKKGADKKGGDKKDDKKKAKAPVQEDDDDDLMGGGLF